MSAPHMPAKYSEARRALAAAHRVDEVKDIHNLALAMEVYAYQAKDRAFVVWAAEIKRRARRRIGELMAEQRAAGKLAKGSTQPTILSHRTRRGWIRR